MNAEQLNTLDRVGLKLLAIRHHGMRFGRIMSTQEVFDEANEAETSELIRTDNAVSLCGDISTEMFAALKREQGAAMRASVFGENRHLYFVVTHQVRSMQHRFILPLYETAVHEFLAHAVKYPVWFSFGDDGRDDAVILRSFEHRRDFKPVLAMTQKWEPEDRVGTLSNLLDATHDLSRLAKIPSCLSDYAVTQVSTTIVAPRTAGEIDESFEEGREELPCKY